MAHVRSVRITRLTQAFLLSALFLPLHVLAQSPDADAEAIKAEIARLDSIWLNAYVTNDVSAVRRILADDFVGQIVGTIQDKDGVLAGVGSSQGLLGMPLDHRVINLYGDVAVVHARRRRVELVDGVRQESPFAYTDVYRYRDGQWLGITGQSATIDP